MPDAKEPTKSLSLLPRPLLFVDIDGVLSVFGFAPNAAPQGTWTQVDGIAHLLSATAARNLHRLRSAYELVWCSGWEEKANDYLPHLLGLGPFPHLSFPMKAGTEHWKIESVERHAANRAMAWIDDDFNDACHAWAARRPAPTLLVSTDPARGLDDEAADQLLSWAQDLAAAPR
jgi:hypothetical protein